MKTLLPREGSAGIAIGTALVASLLLFIVRAAPASPLPAFPGAEGFGAQATGGRGGTLCHVTNLLDEYINSLVPAPSQKIN